MTGARLAALVAAVVALASAGSATAQTDGCATAPAPGSTYVHVAYGGLQRGVEIHIPPALAAGQKVPLLLALHGSGSSGPKMESYSGFSSVADQNHFIAVYPSAAGPNWNIYEAKTGADDVGFISEVIAMIEAEDCVDATRVFATGVSNGAGMVELLGCRLSSVLTAIAPVEGLYDGEPQCKPSRPMSVLEIHGTADNVAPYYGRSATASSETGVPPVVRQWVHRDSCSTLAQTRQIAVRTMLYTFSRCKGQAAVKHVKIIGGAHQWPGASPPDPGPPATICASCLVWSFFAGLTATAPAPAPTPTPAKPPPSGSGGAPISVTVTAQTRR
jgi:polyhydroxybutyrate depolymerase